MLIYDIEIASAIEPDKGKRKPNIKYCDGFEDYEQMGIACICCYDFREQRYRVFDQHSMNEFWQLLDKRTYVIGFNNRKFDDNLLRAYWKQSKGMFSVCPLDDSVISYDVLAETYKAIHIPVPGSDVEWKKELHSGYSLDAMSRTNLGISKTGNGATAPIDFQQGRFAKVVDYCLMDIKLTKELLDGIVTRGYLMSPKTGMKMKYEGVPEYFGKFYQR